MREARVQALSLKIEKMIYNPRWLCKMIGQASRRRAAIDWPPAEWSRWNVSLSRDPPPASGHRHARCGPRPSPTPANLANAARRACAGASSALVLMSTPMRRTRSPCCTRAAKGHAATPPSSAMNSRRIIRSPRRRGRNLRLLLNSYQKNYNETRTHLSLHKDAPITRAVQTVGHTWRCQFWANCTTDISERKLPTRTAGIEPGRDGI
jgi:hypothetical protein